MLKLLLIAVGGGAGALARYGVAHLGHKLSDDALPAATLAVNVAGCFAIGALASAFAGPWAVLREEYRVAILVGVLGGLTTFSAFGLESARMIETGAWGRAIGFVALNNIAGIGGVFVGSWLAGRFLGG